MAAGTSIFDPVLCELAYRWFCPPGGQIVDPFAGGSVRGIVAGHLGYKYWGCDLSRPQIVENRKQVRAFCPRASVRYEIGDATAKLLNAPLADFIFSCPPYGDLERYSDDPLDISTMAYDKFLAGYRAIVSLAVGRLREDRFACFVVGDFRDKRGFYRNFPGDTIGAFHDAGAILYNDAVLVTSLGSLPIRVGKQFTSARKLGKTHQNVLVFVKGDPVGAVAACGDVEVTMPFGEDVC